MALVTVKVDASGRMVIPREMRESLGIARGGELRLTVEDGELRGQTRLTALRRIQQVLRGAERPPTSPVSELLAERRADAEREEDEAGQITSRHHRAASASDG